MLNLGPKADGTFCEQEQNIISEIGKWTKKNEEAIWGTQPYKVFGEGKNKKAALLQSISATLQRTTALPAIQGRFMLLH